MSEITQQVKIKNSHIAATRNVTAFHALVTRLINRSPDQGGLGVFYGWSGLGKSKSASFAAQSTQAAWVEIGQYTTAKKLMEYILLELQVVQKGSVADMIDAAVQALAENPERPLIIDESHWLVERRMTEVIKELSDKSGAPIIMIGEEMLPHGLAQSERVWRRVLEPVPALPADMDDARKLAVYHASEIQFNEDLLQHFVTITEGNAGWLVNNLSDAVELAHLLGVERIGLAEWGDRAVRHGTLPTIRAQSIANYPAKRRAKA